MRQVLRKPARQYDMDMCSGPLLGKIVRYTLPVMATGMLQLMYNAADVIVVGRYTGSTALAAVGSTTSFINLLVNLFLGLSVGVSVVVAQGTGARDYDAVNDAVHTAMGTAAITGLFVGGLGFVISRICLEWMGSPPDVIDQATLYLHIYFLGVPGVMIYNFGAGILRAVGDTTRPLLFLTVSGLINVGLNLLFVISFGMGVAGVAWATIISQYVSAVLVVLCLMRADGAYHLDIHAVRIRWAVLKSILRIGLPAGLQSAVFSISNVLIQSSVNSFGSAAMAGNAAGNNIDGFVYTGMNSVTQAAMTFTGQNVGARKYERIGSVCRDCLLLCLGVGIALGFGAYFMGDTLLRIYTDDPAVIRYGMIRLTVLCTTYFTCGAMDCLSGILRGMGQSLLPMLVTMLGACGLRILWLATVFAATPTLPVLYVSYPISWVITASVHLICYFAVKRRHFSPQRENLSAV